MNLAKQTTLLLAVLLGLAAPVEARTWRVMRDGTGDYTAIQPAIDAAASGDTVVIGPGRYMEKQSVTLPGWGWPIDVYVYVRTGDLALMGTDRDSVVIGPDARDFHDFGPKGIVVGAVIRANISMITLCNMYDGIYTEAESRIDSCAFRGCKLGVVGFSAGLLSVARCSFTTCDIGVISDNPTSNLAVSRSTFNGCGIGADAVATPSVTIQGCDFSGGTNGIQFEQGSQGLVTGCRVSHPAIAAIYVGSDAEVIVERTATSGGLWSLSLSGGSATGSGDIFSGASAAVIATDYRPFSFHNTHFIRGRGVLLDLSNWHTLPDTHLDMRNNYWGIADRDSIAALILDGNDDPEVHAFVDFEPFSTTPLPTEKKSLGGVKGMFR